MDKACFFDRVKALDTGNRAALRQAAGTMLSRADGKAYAAFYQAYPPKAEPEGYALLCCLPSVHVESRRPAKSCPARTGGKHDGRKR